MPLIFAIAKNYATAAQKLELGKDLGPEAMLTSKVIMRARDLMQQHVDKSGNLACRELKAFCRNKKHLVPDEDVPERERPYFWFCIDEVIDPKALAAMSLGMKA